MDKKIVKNSIVINAPATVVWDALINPEQTKKYMFGCETVSDWKPGSPLLWRMIHEGKEFIPVKGNILEIEPNSHLKYTVFDPNSAMEDIPENYLNVTYKLSEENGQTTLVVSQDGFETAAEGEKRYQDVYNNGEGWQPILVLIKNVLEA
ncbi:MAG: SRPBCC domain-containing protein [Ferruginibacter sp.]